jgi:hypothetical protein
MTRMLLTAGLMLGACGVALGAGLAVWKFAVDDPAATPSNAPPATAVDNRTSRPLLDANRRRRAAPDAGQERLSGPDWFANVTRQAGVDFRHVSGDCPEKPFPSANGSGVAVCDFDRDGWRDLYFATGTPFPVDLSRSAPINRFYRNRGNWEFVEVTEETGTGHNGFSAGLAVGDYDSDGFPDIHVSCFGADCLLRNLGDGTFERVEREAGVDDPRWGASSAFLDFDEDGLLDLYICHYAKWSWEENQYCGDLERGIRLHCGPHTVEPMAHALYRNRGDGTFEDASAAAKIDVQRGRGQGVVAADLNMDGLVDLYVANDLNPNFLFLNEGGGKFRDLTEMSGAAYDELGKAQAGMGLDVADVNGDGLPELFVTNFAFEYNTLYENVGGEFFHDASNRYGVVSNSLPHVGWGTAFRDFNLDGELDLIVTNGHVDDNRDTIVENASHEQLPLLYRGEGGRFHSIGAQGGEYFRELHVGRGLAVADLDNDGDEDVVITHQDNSPALLRNETLPRASHLDLPPGENESGPSRPSITIRLIGIRANRDAIGASVTLKSKSGAKLLQVKGGGSYLSASDVRLISTVGELDAAHPDGALSDGAADPIEAEIVWPGGKRSRVGELQRGREYIILEPAGESSPVVAIVPTIESPL